MHSAEIDDEGGASGNDGVVGEGNGLTSEDIGSRVTYEGGAIDFAEGKIYKEMEEVKL